MRTVYKEDGPRRFCRLDTKGNEGDQVNANADMTFDLPPRCVTHCRGASGRCGADELALLGNWSMKLHPDLQTNAAVPIDRDVTPNPRLLRTHSGPDEPTALRLDARKLGRARLASAIRTETQRPFSLLITGTTRVIAVRLSGPLLMSRAAAILRVRAGRPPIVIRSILSPAFLAAPSGFRRSFYRRQSGRGRILNS
jgi:hypothetical protein